MGGGDETNREISSRSSMPFNDIVLHACWHVEARDGKPTREQSINRGAIGPHSKSVFPIAEAQSTHLR